MNSTMIGTLGAAFSVALMLGLWGEEAHKRAGSTWRAAPAALGVLRGELVVLLGLMVLLLLRPMSWVPFVVLAVAATWVGRLRFVQATRQRCRWWQRMAVGVALLMVWLAVVTVFQPETVSLDLRFSRTCVATFLAYCVFSAARDLVKQMVSWLERRCRGGRSGEYVAVPEGA